MYVVYFFFFLMYNLIINSPKEFSVLLKLQPNYSPSIYILSFLLVKVFPFVIFICKLYIRFHVNLNLQFCGSWMLWGEVQKIIKLAFSFR